MSAKRPKVVYRLILQTADGPDVVVKLRQLLKVALRRFGLKCLRIERVEAAANPSDGTSTLKKE